jgi:pimeloyl-ACP methyl ester carboxylesterase
MNRVMNAAAGTPSVEQTEPAVVITLVHGTFAPDAAWTRPDSALRSRWPATPERPVRFSVFEWSGGNSHQDRVTAAGELAEHIRALTTEYDTASHLVVAHSHGGNVALGALSHEDLKGKVKGLICLNTPFLHCARRDLLPLLLVLIGLNPLTLLVLSGAPFLEFYMLPRYPGEYWRPMLITAGLFMAAMIPVGFAGFWFLNLTWRIQGAIEAYQARGSEKFRCSADPARHVLAATVKQDEAYRYLWLLDRITGATTLGAGISFFLILGGFALVLLAGSGGFLTDFNWFPALTRAALTTALYGALAIAAAVVLFLVSAIVMAATCSVLRGHKFSYGEQFVDSLLLRISVKPYPPGPVTSDVRYFVVTSRGLKHSALYGSPEVVQSLAEWFCQLPDAPELPKP